MPIPSSAGRAAKNATPLGSVSTELAFRTTAKSAGRDQEFDPDHGGDQDLAKGVLVSRGALVGNHCRGLAGTTLRSVLPTQMNAFNLLDPLDPKP